MSHVATRKGMPVGFWRTVGHSHNVFFPEIFVAEMAFDLQQGPLALRRQLLTDAPRYLAVLDLAASQAAWGGKLSPGHRCSMANQRVPRVVCEMDCGIVVNPGIVAQRREGAVAFALAAALYGKVDIHDDVVQQKNLPNYRMLQLAQAPLVPAHRVASTRPPAGVGEPDVPPQAPAVANALFALTGKRLRALPLRL